MIEWGAGLAGGCAGVAVGHPFDTLKVKLQTQDHRNPLYRGTFDCAAKTVKREGLRGLYRGMASPMAGVGAVNAVIFGVHGAVAKRAKDPNALSTHFVGGVCAGITQAFICCPVELTKTRMQIQSDMCASTGARPTYAGPLHCLKEIYRKNGVRGVFKGQLITHMREIPAFGTYFLSFEWASRKISGGCENEVGPGAVLAAGGLAGTLSWLICYPMDVIKTRLQSDGAFGPARYKGIVDCASASVREEGWKVFTRGLNSTLLRAFPSNAATFLVVSTVLKHHRQQEHDIDTETVMTGLQRTVLKDIYRTGEVILNAASLAQEACDFHKSFLRKIQENHMANFLPMVINNSQSPFTLSNVNHSAPLAVSEHVSCLEPHSVVPLDVHKAEMNPPTVRCKRGSENMHGEHRVEESSIEHDHEPTWWRNRLWRNSYHQRNYATTAFANQDSLFLVL